MFEVLELKQYYKRPNNINWDLYIFYFVKYMRLYEDSNFINI